MIKLEKCVCLTVNVVAIFSITGSKRRFMSGISAGKIIKMKMISCNNVVQIINKLCVNVAPLTFLYIFLKAIFQSDESEDEKHNMNKD